MSTYVLVALAALAVLALPLLLGAFSTSSPSEPGPAPAGSDPSVLFAQLDAPGRNWITPAMLLRLETYLREPLELPRPSGRRTLGPLLDALEVRPPVLALPIPGEEERPGATLLVEHEHLPPLVQTLDGWLAEPERVVTSLARALAQPEPELRAELAPVLAGERPAAPTPAQELLAFARALRERAALADAATGSLVVRYLGPLEAAKATGDDRDADGEGDAAAKGDAAHDPDQAALAALLAGPFEEAREHLRLALVPPWVPEADPEVPLLAREDLPGTLSVLQLELRGRLHAFGAEDAAPWGVAPDALFAAALEEARRVPWGEPVAQRALGEVSVLAFQHPQAGAHALLLGERPELVGPGGTLFALPYPDVLVVAPQTDPSDDEACGARLAAVLELCDEVESRQPPLLDGALLRAPDGTTTALEA